MQSLNGNNTNNVAYTNWIGFIFVFNLIVGTGALTLPAVFAKAGWLLSLLLILLLAFVSYVTCTFVIEAIACANAIKSWKTLQMLRLKMTRSNDNAADTSDTDDEQQSLLTANEDNAQAVDLLRSSNMHIYYKLDEKCELGEMSALFFNRFGRILFYLCFAIYLFGDLSIYSAAIAKSLRDIMCNVVNDTNKNNTNDFMQPHLYSFANAFDVNGPDKCWQLYAVTRSEVYRLVLLGFTVLFGPMAAFSVQKTKYLQILTVLCRWLAFTFMIALSLKIILTDGAKGHPPAVNLVGLPSLFGACVYSFMCHHSLPGLLAPISEKLKFTAMIKYDYVVITLFYIMLAMTGVFAFAHLEDLYTLNFIPTAADIVNGKASLSVELIIIADYFLALFPVFTLSASYPIIAITLRNNLQSLFLDPRRLQSYNFFVRKLLFPLVVVVPPFVITYSTESLTTLVAFTGGYAGVGIQYIIPICLVYFGRKTCKQLLGSGITNVFESAFRSNYWLAVLIIWSISCISFITLNFLASSVK